MRVDPQEISGRRTGVAHLAGLLFLTATGCSGSAEPTPSVVVTLAKAVLEYVGETVQATATLTNLPGASVTWRSLDESVATVNTTGLITAVANGATSIQATAGGVTGATSVTVAQQPAAIVFTIQPGEARGGIPLGTQPVVRLDDAGGTALAGTGPSVSLTLGENPAGGTLMGPTTVEATDGIASFTELAIDRVGSYVLVASVPDGLQGRSVPFDVTLGPLSLDSSSVTVERDAMFVQDTIAVTATVRDAGGNQFPQGGNDVSFVATDGSSSVGFGPVIDNGDGTYAAELRGVGFGTPVIVRAAIDGQLTTRDEPAATVIGFTAIGAGGWHTDVPDVTRGATCGILNTSELYCWGDGTFGNLGHGAFANSPSPVLVAGGHLWQSVSVGELVTCGITTDGAAYCWGSGDSGGLGNGESGNGSADNRAEPTAVITDVPFRYIAVSPFNGACAVTNGDAGACWGTNTFGRLGDGTRTDRDVPTAVAGGLSFGSLDLGIAFGCGVATDGAGHCWGTSSGGVLGTGDTPPPDDCDGIPCALQPVAVSGGLSFSPLSVATGGNVACALEQSTAKAFCWGSGDIGDGSQGSSTPAEVAGGLAFTMLDANDLFICGLTTSGDAYCWGDNREGQLGIGSQANASTPQLVQGGFSFIAIATGRRHACGLLADGVAQCWGGNGSGELGDGTMERRLTPVRVRFFQQN